MTSQGFALALALGSVIGAVVATPNESQTAVFAFAFFNALVLGLAYHLGSYGFVSFGIRLPRSARPLPIQSYRNATTSVFSSTRQSAIV